MPHGNPDAKSQGIKQLMAGGVALIGTQLIPSLSGLFCSDKWKIHTREELTHV